MFDLKATSCILALITLLLAITVLASAEEKKDAAPKPLYAQVSDAEGLIAAVSKLPNEGGAIVILPGTYEIKDTLLIKGKSNVSITGSGWSTVIKKKGDGDAIVFEGSCWSCLVKSLVIEGDANAKTGSGIVFRNGEWSGINMIDYCHIRAFPVSGIRFEGNKERPFSSNTVSNCWFTNNMGDQLYSFCNNDFYMTTNQFGAGGGKNPKTGARLDHSSAGTYTMNYHWGNVNALKLGPGSHFNRIENNRFEESTETGVIVGDPKDDETSIHNIFTGNTFHTNSKSKMGAFPAIEALNAHATTFTSNQAFSWDCDHFKHKSSLVLGKGCMDWIVKDNILRYNTEKAIVCDEKSGHIVKDNIVDK